MAKHIDALKPFDQFRAPWETETGDEADIDKPKLKRYIYGLVSDKAKAQDARDEATEALKTAETERDEAKADAQKASPDEANKKIERLERDNAKLKADNASLTAEKERTELRSEVLAGLDPKYAKYVTGETREELEESLGEVKADFGLGDDDADDGEDEDEDTTIRTRPRRTNLRNPVDPESGRGSDDIDFDKVADEYLGGSIFH